MSLSPPRSSRWCPGTFLLGPALLALAGQTAAQDSFVNWETPHVHPLEMTPSGARLLAVNTPDNRLEVFDSTGDELLQLRPISVGIDPVTVRARTNTEVWVVNHLSDSISIVDLATSRVRYTLTTSNEPCDVVFAGVPQRAFVSCSQAREVLVYDPLDLSAAPAVLAIDAREPRALAVSPSGDQVYAAIFESGNASTLIAGGSTFEGDYPPPAVDSPLGPYGGVNPPPNDGPAFDPPKNGANGAAPLVGLIVKRSPGGQWLDDNEADWTPLISGPQAAESGRLPGWDLPDRDIAVINVSNLAVSYVSGLMNINMGMAVNPASGAISVVGTEATNEVRFEAKLTGTFVRAMLATVTTPGLSKSLVDLNPHLDYSVGTVAQPLRDQSIGTPRAIAWNAAGTRAYVAGAGSNNLVVLDPAGARVGLAPTIETAEGPTGLALDEARDRLFVLAKFESAVSVIDLTLETEAARVPIHDPSPVSIRDGRRHLYGTHETSGLGQVACSSCHVDSRTDGLAWDLGNPAGSVLSLTGQNLGADHPLLPASETFFEFHPMKGPMLTQTLQDIIGKEPLHWRGDKKGVEDFNAAFVGLHGDDEMLDPVEMQEMEDFLATIHYPPNPFRDFDNSLEDDVPLPGHYTTGKFGPPGLPLPNGDAQNGLDLFLPPNTLDGQIACATCHTIPTGLGTDMTWMGGEYEALPEGPSGEHHHMLLKRNGQGQTVKVPHLRNLYERTGFDTTQLSNSAGFGFINDGSMDSLARLMNLSTFEVQNVQETADLVAFLLSFSGSDLPTGAPTQLLHAPGTESRDTHAAVGRQVTLGATPLPQDVALLDEMKALADAGAVGLVGKGRIDTRERGFVYLGGEFWQTDKAGVTTTSPALTGLPAPGESITFTVVPLGTEHRIGIDRDADTYLDGDEVVAMSDPADASSVPATCTDPAPAAPTGFSALTEQAGEIALVWNDQSPDAIRFLLERAPTGTGHFELVTSLPANASGVTDIGLGCGQVYDYRLYARGCGGDSAYVTATATSGACPSLIADVPGVSLSAGGSQNYSLQAGPANSDDLYFFLGSITGVAPGFFYGGHTIPLNIDPYFLLLLLDPGGSPIANGFNALDAGGEGVARLTIPPGMDPTLAGVTVHHAYIVLDSATLFPVFVSNPVQLLLDP